MNPILLALFAAIFWGVAAIVEKMGLLNIDPIIAVFIRSLAVTLIMVISFPLLYPGFFKAIINTDKKTLILIVTGGVLAAFLGQLFYFKALKIGEASRIIPVATTYPLITLIISVVYLKEELTLFKVLGIMFITIGVWLIRH